MYRNRHPNKALYNLALPVPRKSTPRLLLETTHVSKQTIIDKTRYKTIALAQVNELKKYPV